jgi:hypothetical protein
MEPLPFGFDLVLRLSNSGANQLAVPFPVFENVPRSFVTLHSPKSEILKVTVDFFSPDGSEYFVVLYLGALNFRNEYILVRLPFVVAILYILTRANSFSYKIWSNHLETVPVHTIC